MVFSKYVSFDVAKCFQCESLTKLHLEKDPYPRLDAKNVRPQKSKINATFIIFCDADGIIHKEFAHEGTTITGHCCFGVLRGFEHAMKTARHLVYSCYVHDNAPKLTWIIVLEFLASKRIRLAQLPSLLTRFIRLCLSEHSSDCDRLFDSHCKGGLPDVF